MSAYWEEYSQEDLDNYYKEKDMEQKQYDNTNRGTLFVNERKQTETHPDYTGSININGVDHWLSGWKKTSKKGQMFLSLSIGKPKEQKPQEWQQAGQQLQQNNESEINVNDIPFG